MVIYQTKTTYYQKNNKHTAYLLLDIQMKKSTHSKIKNTAILFELLSRQVAADTISGVEASPALTIIKEFFKADSALAKELMLYQTLLKEKYNNS